MSACFRVSRDSYPHFIKGFGPHIKVAYLNMTRKNLIRNSEIQQSSQQSSPLPPPTYEAATSKMEHPLPVRQHQAPYSDNPAKDSEKSLHVGLHEVNCQPKKGIFTRRVLAARVKHTFLAVTLLLGGAFLFHTIYAVSPQYRPSVGHVSKSVCSEFPDLIVECLNSTAIRHLSPNQA